MVTILACSSARQFNRQGRQEKRNIEKSAFPATMLMSSDYRAFLCLFVAIRGRGFGFGLNLRTSWRVRRSWRLDSFDCEPLIIEQVVEPVLLPLLRLAIDLFLVGDDFAQERKDFIVSFQLQHAVEHVPHLDEDFIGQDE